MPQHTPPTAHRHGHPRHHHHDGPDAAHDEAGLMDLLDLDARALGPAMDELTAWIAGQAPETVRTVLDVGAGTGAGSFALARRFESAEVIALDQSEPMLTRLSAAARDQGLGGRLRTVRADLDEGWPDVGGVDLAWAASSLHHVADPDRVLHDIHAALNPAGLFVAVEMDTPPRFLSHDLGVGRPGLEDRCQEAMAEAGWNAHPDWGPHLERAGFTLTGRRAVTAQARLEPETAGRFAHAWFSRVRHGLAEELAADDLATLDQLLTDDGPDTVRARRDLDIRSARTVWAARRP